jgi:hypothetical protein
MQKKLLLAVGMILNSLFFAPTICAQGAGVGANAIYGGLWEIGPRTSTDLTLKALGQPLTATVMVYSSSGVALGTQAIPLQTGQSTQVSLASFVSGSGQGGLAVQWTGSGGIEGSVSITGDNGINASYPLQSGNRYDSSNTLYAPWYLPDDGTGGTLSLFNSGSGATQVAVSVVVSGTEKELQTVSLQPNAEQALDLRSLLENSNLSQANMGAIEVRYTGAAHALQPALLLESPATGFGLMPAFAAKHSQQGQSQTTWQFPFVPIPITASGASSTAAGLTSYALVSNGTAQQMAAQVMSYTVMYLRSVSQNLNVPALAPYETRLINLGTSQPPWVGSTAAPQQTAGATASRIQFNPAGISVTHSGIPGDVAISIFTVDSSGQVVATSSGIVLPTTSTNVGYLNTAFRTPVEYSVSNANTSTDVTLYYQGLFGVGSYTAALPQPTKSGAGIDLVSAFQSGSSDLNGLTLPSAVRAGILVLSTSAPNPAAIAAVQPECLTACAVTLTPAPSTSASTAQSTSTAGPRFTADDLSGADPNACLFINNSTQCITNGTVTVVVGQQINVRAVIPPLYAPATIQQTWTWYNSGGAEATPTNYAIGCKSGFTYSGSPCSGSNILSASLSSGYNSVASNFPLPTFNNANGSNNTTVYTHSTTTDASYNSAYTFYWIYPPTSTLTLTYSYVQEGGPGGSGTGYASVTFNVTGFSSSSALFGYSFADLSTPALFQCATVYQVLDVVVWAGTSSSPCNDFSTSTIDFNYSQTSPNGAGSFQWVQYVDSSTMTWYNSSGTTCPSGYLSYYSAGLDTTYPYATGTSTNDSPSFGWEGSLSSSLTSAVRYFDGGMYLLWTPVSLSGGSPEDNAIFVPASNLTWSDLFAMHQTSGSWSPTTSSVDFSPSASSGNSTAANPSVNFGYPPNWSGTATVHDCP